MLNMEDKHILVKKYLEQHSLVESNILSFNDFLDNRMQQIVEEVGKNLPTEDVKLELGKISVGKPNIIEADGSKHDILPAEARLRNLTYSAPLYLEISIKSGSESEKSFVEIGRIPIMVKSKYCHLFDMPHDKLVENYVDYADPGGYFIINGNERVLVMIEDLAPNQPFIEKSPKVKETIMLRLFSQRGAYRIPTSLNESSDGLLTVTFSRFRDIPAIPLIKALGLVEDSSIARYIGKEQDSLVVNLYEYAHLHNPHDALLFIAEKSGLQGAKKEILERAKARIDSYFLPHIGTKPENRIEKAITLCKLIKQYTISKESRAISDKDHYANKRIKLSGDLFADLFRVNLTVFVRDIQHSLQRISKRKKFYSLKTIAKSTLFSHRIESAIATGGWIGERTGVTQNMDKTNYLAMFSQLQRVISLLPSEQENFKARMLHPTHYGRFCPIETPEGTPIGLRKNLALLSRISTAVRLEEKELVNMLTGLGLLKEGSGMTDVFYNGKFIGEVITAEDFVDQVREKRRKKDLPIELSVRHDKEKEAIFLTTETGRLLRPLIIVKDGRPLVEKEHLELLSSGTLAFNDIVSKGLIEYLDAAEEDDALIALYANEITPEHTHLEIDPIAMFGLVTSLVPYANYDQSSRLNRGSKTQKQALGLYSSSYHVRLDTDVSILHYPQKPIVRSFVYDTLDFYPAGQNVVVAIMPYEGYNIEDAIVMNKASIERGLGRSTYLRPYTSVELQYTGGLTDEICIPSKDTGGYKTEKSYRFLEDDGIAYPEAKLEGSDVVVGKTSPPKFLSEMGEMSIARSRKENSVIVRQEEEGIIDSVFITIDAEGNKIVNVRTRDPRSPELGDKFSTPHGQKGVIGAVVPEEDIPFTAQGIKPDIIFNPHGIPSRMTVGYLIELLAGKVGCLDGRIIDGTAFSGENIEELERTLCDLGFRSDGKETLYDGVTGKMLEAKIFIGNMYYLKLKYMVANKIHARAFGKVTLLTRQPVEGRSQSGGLRLGEMEKDALVGHGASLLLKERYDSDRVVVHVCTQCGSLAIKDILRKKEVCLLCGISKVEPVEMSYAFKLFMEELLSLHIFPHLILKNKYE